MADTDDTKRVAVTLLSEQAETLRIEAGKAGVGPGLLSRALVTYGLDHIDDPAIRAAIETVKEADRDRRRRIGEKAMQSRWHGGTREENPG